MNLFSGLTDKQILSFVLSLAEFNLFLVLEAVALAAFYLASRPQGGRVRTAALWHVAAAVWFNLAVVSTVWSAPAEKSFVNGSQLFDPGYDRFQKVIIGLAFAAAGILCLAVGIAHGATQRRARRQAEQAA